MNKALLGELATGWTKIGNVGVDVVSFLSTRGRHETAVHVAAVAGLARQIALLTGENPEPAEQAAWFHDLGRVFERDEMLGAASRLGIEILPEERLHSTILHQKISMALAPLLFGVNDQDVLDAVGCHTTLRAEASPTDKIVYLADKLSWVESDTRAIAAAARAALAVSLDEAIRVYLEGLWNDRLSLPVVHPWIAAAWRWYLHVDGAV